MKENLLKNVTQKNQKTSFHIFNQDFLIGGYQPYMKGKQLCHVIKIVFELKTNLYQMITL